MLDLVSQPKKAGDVPKKTRNYIKQSFGARSCNQDVPLGRGVSPVWIRCRKLRTEAGGAPAFEAAESGEGGVRAIHLRFLRCLLR